MRKHIPPTHKLAAASSSSGEQDAYATLRSFEARRHPSGRLLEIEGLTRKRAPLRQGMTSVVTENGRVEIPKPLLETLAIEAGTVLDFRAENGELVAVKRPATNPLAKWRGQGTGIVQEMGGVDAYLSSVRDRDQDGGG